MKPDFNEMMESRGATKLPDVSLINGMKGREGCHWCGGALAGRRRKFCQDSCRDSYYENVIWTFARARKIRDMFTVSPPVCVVRMRMPDWAFFTACGSAYGHPGRLLTFLICDECLGWIRYGDDVEVHHIEELNGQYRNVNILNHQDNLLGLCHECHRHSEKYHGGKS